MVPAAHSAGGVVTAKRARGRVGATVNAPFRPTVRRCRDDPLPARRCCRRRPARYLVTQLRRTSTASSRHQPAVMVTPSKAAAGRPGGQAVPDGHPGASSGVDDLTTDVPPTAGVGRSTPAGYCASHWSGLRGRERHRRYPRAERQPQEDAAAPAFAASSRSSSAGTPGSPAPRGITPLARPSPPSPQSSGPPALRSAAASAAATATFRPLKPAGAIASEAWRCCNMPGIPHALLRDEGVQTTPPLNHP